MKFSIRLDDLEVRSCGKHFLVESEPHDTAELIKWEDRYCYVLAYWIGGDLKL